MRVLLVGRTGLNSDLYLHVHWSVVPMIGDKLDLGLATGPVDVRDRVFHSGQGEVKFVQLVFDVVNPEYHRGESWMEFRRKGWKRSEDLLPHQPVASACWD